MGILITPQTRGIIQGITGRAGRAQIKWMQESGVNIVAGVSPGKGGEVIDGIPVYDTVKETVDLHGANASAVLVPAAYAKSAVLEAIDNKLELVVCTAEYVPSHDTLIIANRARKEGVVVIGPNTGGVITPGVGKLGILPAVVFKPGRIGLISRSGSLSFEVAGYINEAGYGESTVIGIGGDPIRCTDVPALLNMFEQDSQTDMVVLIGEIGGTMEEDAALTISRMKKPVIAYIAGQTAPEGKRMGHAGAIITGSMGTAESKRKALTEAGALVVERIQMIPSMIEEAYEKMK
jgi:succinyl-CoA synthetase alpha subunit